MPRSELLTETDRQALAGGPGGQPATDGVSCQVFTAWEPLEPMRSTWDEFIERAGGEIHFTYDWCRTWWRYYGSRYRLRVLLFRCNGRIVGLLPMMLDRLWLGPIPLQMAKLIGSDYTLAVLNLPVLPDHAETVYAMALEYLLQDQRCDLVRFNPISGERPYRRQIVAACERSRSYATLIRERGLQEHAVLTLPDSFEAYLARLGSEFRSTVRRKRRKFESECKPVREILTDPEQVMPAFEEFLELHATRWQAEGRLGHFGDHPQAADFNRDLVRAMTPQGRVWMQRLRVDGQTVASEFNFVFAGTLHWRLPARRLGEQWERFSIGVLSLTYLFEACMQRGIHRVEAGGGSIHYKRQLGGMVMMQLSLIVAANRPWALFKSRYLLRACWRVLNMVHRIWVIRIGPRLPKRMRPSIWGVWMRMRI